MLPELSLAVGEPQWKPRWGSLDLFGRFSSRRPFRFRPRALAMGRIEPWQTYQRLWLLAMLPENCAIQFPCRPLGYNEAYFVVGASDHVSVDKGEKAEIEVAPTRYIQSTLPTPLARF